jgi:hypothetical protein
MNKNSQNTLIDSKKLIGAKYIFIDGISRSGKAAIVPLISSMPNTEHFKNNYNIDRIVNLMEMEKITKDGFRYMFQTDLITDTWFTMIGRNQNTNKHDLTSILNSPKSKKYKKRENKKDNAQTFNELIIKVEEQKIKFPYMTDELVFHKKLIDDIVPNSQFIISIRNPIEMIFAWERSGRGTRYGTDQRLLHPTFSKGDLKNIPYFAINDAEKYLSYSSLERCVYSIIKLQKDYYNLLIENPKGIHWINFEEFVTNPLPCLNQLSKFIGGDFKKWDEAILQKSSIPRVLDIEMHFKKTKLIFSGINEELKSQLLGLCFQHLDLFKNHYSADYKKLSLEFIENINFSKLTQTPKYKHGWRIN